MEYLPSDILFLITDRIDSRNMMVNLYYRDLLLPKIRKNYIYDYDSMLKNIDLFDGIYPRIINSFSGINTHYLTNCEILYNIVQTCNSIGYCLDLTNTKIKNVHFSNSDFIQTVNFPDTIEEISGCYWNTTLRTKIPDTTKKIIFNPYIIIKIDTLPSSLTHIYFPDWFDEPLTDILPAKLTHLHLGNSFNNKINKNDIPKTLVEIKFGKKFEQSIKNSFHEGIKTIIFSSKLSISEFCHLPKSVKYLELEGSYYENIYLPNDLETLSVKGNLSVFYIPNNLYELRVAKIIFLLSPLPNSIKILSGKIEISDYISIPKNIKKLSIFDSETDLLDLPETLEYLYIKKTSKNIIIPNNIKHLRLGKNAEKYIKYIPFNTELLELDNHFGREFFNLVPKTIKTIRFAQTDHKYSNCEYSAIPSFIEIVEFNSCMDNYNHFKKIPKTVKKIIYNVSRNQGDYIYIETGNTKVIQKSGFSSYF